MHLPPQDSVPVASLADGSATFFDGGPLGEVDVLLGGAPGFRDGGAVYAKFRGALYLAADYRDQDSVYVSDANNSCIRRVRFRRRQDCGRGPSHADEARMSQADDDAASFPDSDAGLMRGYLGVDDAKFWFVLSQNRLSYFEDADADVPLGTLPVDAVRSVRASKLNPREYAMRISTADVAFHRELSTSRGAPPPPPPRNSSARNSFGAQFGFDARFPPSLRSLVDARACRHREGCGSPRHASYSTLRRPEGSPP